MAAVGVGTTQAAVIDVTTDVTASETWTSDNTYILTQVIYVTNGATLTIEPGTVIRGEGESSPGANDPGTLVITRDSKIQALGTKDKPIVFTDLNDDNIGNNPGTFPYDTLDNALSQVANWGGVILLGRTYVANNTAGAANPAREVQIEGLTPAGGLGLYGNGGNDNDDSGTMRYVSIRYGGFNLSANNEINGLTLGAVGRNTDLEYIEIVNSKDDGIECFGGTVNIKHFIMANLGDDSLDYDEGFRGKGQFIFLMQGTPGADRGDKGGEHDGGNGPDTSLPMSMPTLYNVTSIGLGGTKAYTNSLTNTGIHFRDNAGGRYYNSFFADFGGAPFMIEGGSLSTGGPTDAGTSGERAITPYVVDGTFYLGPAGGNQLELRDDYWWCTGNGGVVPSGDATAVGGDAGKYHFDGALPDGDGNTMVNDPNFNNSYAACGTTPPIQTFVRTPVGNPAVPDIITSIDPRPTPAGPLTTTARMAPNDGFYEPAPYKGAFSPTDNWAKGWSTLDRLGYFPPQTVTVSGQVTTSQTWKADHEYILTEVVYVTNGATLTIEPGTVIRGEGESSPGANDPGTLVITRDSKIQALGTRENPIVFTDLNDDNIGHNPGTFPYDTFDNALSQVANWGGVILLGRTYVANNTAGAANPAREVQIEGLTPAGGLGLYGNGGNDDDDSGTMRYVSIRYGGFNLSANNEINGLTLGAVGRNTDLEYIEVMNSKDDGIESFGGTETLKHIILANLGDDSLDYDEGFRGKGQFIFLMQGTPGADRGDKGGEHDGGNGPDTSLPMSMPTLYNVTSIGLGGTKAYTNSLTNTGIHFRDNAGGRYYNSFFADFGGAPFMIEGGSLSTGGPTDAGTSGERAISPYVVDAFYQGPAGGNQLELRDDYWWCTGNGGVVPSGDATTVGGDAGKYHFDGVLPDGDGNTMVNDPNFSNTYAACGTSSPMVDFLRIPVGNPAVPDIIGRIDPRPQAAGPLASTTRMAPNDGFFEQAAYKGAFAPGQNWANGWSTLSRVQYFGGCAAGATSSSPDLVENLRIGGLLGNDPDLLRWDAPAGADGSEMYDVLRASSGSGFGSALCLESNDGTDMQATDTAVPAAGSAFFYLVRANNSCADGSLGTTTLGSERTGVVCP